MPVISAPVGVVRPITFSPIGVGKPVASLLARVVIPVTSTSVPVGVVNPVIFSLLE